LALPRRATRLYDEESCRIMEIREERLRL
jgi:hypothetical protein